MTTKPILFNGAMVRAVLDGQKTQTRRPVKLGDFPATHVKYIDENQHFQLMPPDTFVFSYFEEKTPVEVFHPIAPQYRKGTVLWVKETFRLHGGTDECGCGGDRCHCPPEGTPIYRADMDDGESKWNPSIHMKKQYARIFLEVTSVRCEKLWDMTSKDARKEGTTHPERFFGEWYVIYPEEDNPFVWVYEFKRCEKPEGWRS